MTRGSEWRQWDLHVHTASSEDYNYKADDSNQLLVDAWNERGIKAVAITDHFVIDADRIKSLRELDPDITIFPGVELRTDKGSTNVHVIVIFPEDSDLDMLSNYFNVSMLDDKSQGDSFDNYYWDYNDIIEFAKKKNGIISIHAGNKSNGVDDKISNKEIFNMAIKEEYSKTVKIYEVNSTQSLQGYNEHVLPIIGKKPVIICSDNHDPREYTTKERLWIKADLTFNGLLQAIQHPDERVYVGESPIKLEHERNESQYILDSLIIDKDSSAKNEVTWFDTTLKLNSGLITIVGNKGTGKSALSDVLGLLGNSINLTKDNASFLTDKRFNKAPHYYSKDYTSKITWLDGHVDESDSLVLMENKSSQRIQYLPQKYIEKVCSNLQHNDFQGEINNVLFSYISDEEKLGTTSFNDFIEEKTKHFKVKIRNYKHDLSEVIDEIIQHEEKKKLSYKRYLILRKDEIEKELDRELSLKPNEVKEPSGLDSSTEKTEKLDNTIEETKRKIEEKKVRLEELHKQNNELQTICTKIENEITKIEQINTEIENKLSEYQIPLQNKYLFKNYNPANELKIIIENITSEISTINECLYSEEGLEMKLRTLKNEKEILFKESNAEIQEYQKYKLDLSRWQEKIKTLRDDISNKDSLAYIIYEIDYVENKLDKNYVAALEKKDYLIEKIYDEKQNIIQLYKDVYKPIDAKLQHLMHGLGNGIAFSAKSTYIKDANQQFLQYINKQVSTEFQGRDQSIGKINGLLNRTDFDKLESIKIFIEDVLKGTMGRKGNKDFDKMSEAIKNKKLFYEQMFNLSYIQVDYSLTLDNKELTQLSPGERGLVLLIFYLVLSKEKHPIIIDQPEDNLDNQSIFTNLVPCIIEAKKNRQVIVVTHNPNIAIACDSEQLIVASIDKIDNKISYHSGSIENPETNRLLVDILEGTYPAFDLRERKYIFN